METLDLAKTYLHLDGREAAPFDGAGFWEQVAGRVPFDDRGARVGTGGWLVGRFHNAADWTTWEMHPKGDEVVCLLSGAVDFILELPEGVRTVALEAGATVRVPRGVWHTATVREPGDALHITWGAETRHRPR